MRRRRWSLLSERRLAGRAGVPGEEEAAPSLSNVRFVDGRLKDEGVGIAAPRCERARERGTCVAAAQEERLLTMKSTTGQLLPLPLLQLLILLLLLLLLLWMLHFFLRSRDPLKGASLVPAAETALLSREDDDDDHNAWNEACHQHRSVSVHFLAWRTLDFRDLHRGLELHRRGQHLTLEGLSHQLDVALQSEYDHGLSPVLSTQLQTKLTRLADLYEQDQRALGKVLAPFPVALALPAPSSFGEHDKVRKNGTALKGMPSHHAPIAASDDDDHPPVRYFSIPGVPGDNDPGMDANAAASSSYDTVAQIVAHLVRDWSLDGRSIRKSLYGWCTNRVQRHVPILGGSILVPGAGLGRLAYDLATTTTSSSTSAHYHVHAIENSLLMAAAAAHVLLKRTPLPEGQGQSQCVTEERDTEDVPQLVLHPYASDPFTNELNSLKRYRQVAIARDNCKVQNDNEGVRDCDAPPVPSRSSLSYTIGDFATVVSRGPLQSYHAVATSFFLDTVNNVLEFVFLVKQLLVPETGVWINVGPLQWHRNAQLSVTGDELRGLLEAAGFDILEWSVDTKSMEYRSEEHSDNEQQPRSSTHYEAFHPLRFVARRSST